jgi:hypothetical protein
MLVVMVDYLFSGSELGAALQQQASKVREAVEAVPEEHLWQADADEWAVALADEFRVEPPELQVEEMYREEAREVMVDVGGDPHRYFSPFTANTRIRGYRIVVRIPFTGDSAVFELRPSSFTYNPPVGEVVEDELTYTLDYPHDSPPNIDEQVNDFVGTVQQWLGFARGDIESFNNTLVQEAQRAISDRRRRIEQRDAHLATSTIPVGKPGNKRKTYIAEAIVRRPAPKLPKAKATEQPVQLEPVLADAIFEHILGVVRMQALQLEQSPKTYAALDEEARRDLFVATLNTHYEGRGAAEAFNVNGKTDILIRYEGKSLLIAECKFWTGAKGFTEAIDQLFGYASWRDTKLTLIMFVQEKGLTEIIEKARAALEEHTQFVAWTDAAGETELRAVVSWPGDERRHADLNAFFVHTPA